ncbi:VapE domain-containing protein [Pontibacter sp. 13R65]|uniref:VapE domain-containing protein n=1 Tax=Pontibacter sp. 13R65 TaxID=3127458 RepID=UPI00301D1650
MIPTVSLFKNFNQVQENQPIGQILQSIKSGTYKQQVEQVRLFLQEERMQEYERAKKNLPAFTPCGEFLGGRKMEHLQHYANLVVLDLDKLHVDELSAAKERASKEPYTYAAFTSPSGNGLKILVCVSSAVQEHKQAYSQVKAYYASLLGLKIDESGSDVTRLCFVSYDSDLYLNDSALIFPIEPVLPIVAHAGNIGQHTTSNNQNQGILLHDAQDLYKQCVLLTERRYTFTEGSRNNFVHQLACNLNRYGMSQDESLQFVSTDYNYNEQEVTAAVKSAYSNLEEHASLAFRASSNKKQQPVSAPHRQQKVTVSEAADNNLLPTREESVGGTQIDKIEAFLLDRYSFRFNSVTSRTEYRTSEKAKWKALTDRAESTMLRELKKAQVRVSQAELRFLLSSDFCPLYDPFKAYFKSLPPWDTATDYIAQLAATITTTDAVQWQLCFKKWFVAMTAGVLNEQVVNHTVIVLSGGQGLGKTTWVLSLVPAELKEYLYSGEINPSNKDTLQQLSENMLINLDELENLNRSEIGALKEMVTKSEIKVRKAYGHHHEKMPRRASFGGSVNTAQFLNDTTGSRRFLCFEVTDIDYQHQANLEMAYAQALHLYKEGFRFWFDKEEIKLITSSNERFQVLCVEEELLLTWFVKAEAGQACLFLTTSQLVAKLAEKAKINVSDASANKLGKALRKHGFERKKRGSSYGYLVRELTYDQVDSNNSQLPIYAPDVVPPF